MASDGKFETFPFPTKGKGGGRNQYVFLLDMPTGAHCHFADVKEQAVRSAVYYLNRRRGKQHPEFHLSVHAVSDDDPKGRGFRVLRNDRVTP